MTTRKRKLKPKIDQFFQDLLPPLHPDEVASLESSILSQGCVHPLIVWKETGILIDGHNRLALCSEHNVPFQVKEASFKDRESVELWIIESQLGRRNVTAYARVELALRYEKLFRKMAKARQGHRSDIRLKSDGSVSAMAEVGKVASVSRDTAYKVKAIKKFASTEVQDKASAGEITINAAYRMAKKSEHIKNLRVSPPPEGKFEVIYADPPWLYESDHFRDRFSAWRYYPTLTDEQIFSLPVPNLAHKNSCLFLWATAAKLEMAIILLNRWGFNYKAHWVWDKDLDNAKHKGTTGFWNKVEHEILLLGTKGTVHVPAPKCRSSSIIKAPRTIHSEKPQEAYKLIEETFPDFKRRVELFARAKRPGWEAWGNEHDIETLSKAS